MKIVDAHHHFWDLERNPHPWLTKDGKIPFRYGDYASIRRNYLPDDFRADGAAFDIVGSVHVEAEWDPSDPVGETRWLQSVREGCGLPSVCVAQAWLHHEDAAAILEAQASYPFVRSVRHKPPEPAGFMDSTAWRHGYAQLAKHALSFDLQTPWNRLAEAYRLACDFPDTRIILNHAGLPADRSAAGLAGWRDAMRRFAEAPNTVVKISGIGVPGAGWFVETNRTVVLDAIEIFGVDRCMFASNFPVDSLVIDYEQIFSGFLTITEGFSETERTMLFHDNAVRYYRIRE